MPSKAELKFLHQFQEALKLITQGKLLGIQLRLGEKPGKTVANATRGTK